MPGGPLAFLSGLETARPRAFADQLGAAVATSATGLEQTRAASSLEAEPLPAGPAPAIVQLQPMPEVSEPPVSGPVPRGDAASGTGLEPSGYTDPAQADRWASAGIHALNASASGGATPPTFAAARSSGCLKRPEIPRRWCSP
jgi:hypothetical protein